MNLGRHQGRLLCLLLVTVLGSVSCSSHKPGVLNIGGDFTLTDQNGMPFQLSSLRGKAVLIFFGYTSCPDVCPTTMSKISSVYRSLGPEAPRLKTLFISVDTQRDTPPVLKEYLANFKGVDAIGLTGSVAQINKVTALFGAEYEITPIPGAKPPEETYSVAHTTEVYALDPAGRTRAIFDYDATVADMTKGIREIL
ncbi:MAG TPA: SCO family protein [Verrucomicrobiae bacterium]|nr:SCO family protein [Verrucomicrobiae bacterium]